MEDMQTKLNERVRKHLEWVEGIKLSLKIIAVMTLMIGGYSMLLITKGYFGDVPLVLGLYYFRKILS